MTYHYTDATREPLDTALPDVEVFRAGEGELGTDGDGEPMGAGWYYTYGSPGCLPDSEPSGPYETEAEAREAARDAAGYCPHGVADDAVCEECPAPELWVIECDDGRRYFEGWGPQRWPSAWSTEHAATEAMTRKIAASRGARVVRLPDAEARRWGRSDA